MTTIALGCLLAASCAKQGDHTHGQAARAPEREEEFSWPPEVGRSFPDLEVVDVAGRRQRLSEIQDRPLLLETAAMNCPASVAFAGGSIAGRFGQTPPQPQLHQLEDILQDYAPGCSLNDPRIQTVQLLFLNEELKAPTKEDLARWQRHFAKARKAKTLVLGVATSLAAREAMSAVPGLYLLDSHGMVRYAHEGSKQDLMAFKTLFESIPRLLDPPPAVAPRPRSALVAKVAELYQASPQNEIPAATGLPLERDRQAEVERYGREWFLDLYRGDAGAKWDDDARECVAIVAGNSLEDWLTPGLRSQALAAGRRAYDAGCEDPLLLACLASLLGEQNDPAAATLGRQALAGLKQRGAPAAVLFRAEMILASSMLAQGDHTPFQKAEIDALVADGIEHFVDAARRPDLNPWQQEMLLDDVMGFLGKWRPLHYEIWTFNSAVQDADGVDPWLKHMVAAHCHIAEAWRERGTQISSEVTDEGATGFVRQMGGAATHLAEAWDLRPENPLAATCMLEVMLARRGVADEDAWFWFKQAAGARLDSRRPYAKMLWMLRPRWFGSHEQMLEFGRQCLQTRRFDTRVPYQYAEAVFAIADDSEEAARPAVFKRPAVLEGFQSLYEGLLAESSWPEEAKRQWRSEYAVCAFLAGNVRLAREQIDKLEGQFEPDVLTRFPVVRKAFLYAVGLQDQGQGET